MDKNTASALRPTKYVHLLANKIKRLGDDNLAKHNITLTQLRVLVFISLNSESGKVLQSDIEKEFGIRRSSVTSILKNMEKADLVFRSSNENDARVKSVALTETGIKLNDDLKNYMINVDKEILKGFSETEKKTFMQFLFRAAENLAKLESPER